MPAFRISVGFVVMPAMSGSSASLRIPAMSAPSANTLMLSVLASVIGTVSSVGERVCKAIGTSSSSPSMTWSGSRGACSR